MGLSACNNAVGRRTNANICINFKSTTPTGPATADAAKPLDDCLRKWAYSLAPSTDVADVVAEAVVAACTGTLSSWNQQGLAQPGSGSDQAISITTGQPTNVLAEHANFARSRAELYVVEARAGNCAPPPAANGAPTGLTS
jgi:hypothetical protein